MKTDLTGRIKVHSSKLPPRDVIYIDQHEFEHQSTKTYGHEYRIHSPNGYDSWNAPDKTFRSLIEAIKEANKLLKSWELDLVLESKSNA